MGARQGFAETRWTLVLRAGGASEPARSALAELCEIYYEPVVTFIGHYRSTGDDAAREEAHAFFETILQRGEIGGADEERGRFRSYLLGAVKHFLAATDRAGRAEKRGGGQKGVPLEDLDKGEPAVHAARSEVFDRAWALALIARALSQLEGEMAEAGKVGQFAILKPWLDGNADVPQSEAAAQLGLSGTAVKVAIHRLRERFRAKIRAEVGATVAAPEEVEGELAYLLSVLLSESP